MRLILRKTFRLPPPPVADLLASLAEYQGASGWPRDCRALADAISDSEPFTIILFVGLAFLELTRRGASIPSYILINDKHNRLLLADSLRSFALYPASMGSNCSESSETVQKLRQAGFVVTAVTSDDYSEISEILFFLRKNKSV
jgi:hypothetical protein